MGSRCGESRGLRLRAGADTCRTFSASSMSKRLTASHLALLLAVATPAAAQTDAGDFFGRLATDVQDATAAPRGLATSLPDGFYLETVASGLQAPVGTAFLPGGRMLVLEKLGRLSLVDDGQRRLILDLTDEVLEHGDRGLLGIAVDPRFAQTGWIYLVYTVSPDGQERAHTDSFGRLTRYTLAPDGSVVAGSRLVLIGETFDTGIPTCYYSHSVGTLAFGRDGSLLVGTGDAASYGTVDTGGLYPTCFGAGRFPASEDIGAFRSQSLQSLAGKILRINPATGQGYPSNPFYTGNPADNASRVWALGFRNPFRFTVDQTTGATDPAAGDPGQIIYGDVGWAAWEEVGTVRRGENAGWPCREGFGVQDVGGSYANTAVGRTVCPGLVSIPPAFSWSHGNANTSVPAGRRGNAAVGGPVYRGTRYPAEYRGRAFYADYGQGWMATARMGSDGTLSGDALFLSPGPIVDIQYDAATQNLFFTNVAAGTVQRLRHTAGDANSAPVAVASATPTQGGAPLVVTFSSAGAQDPDGDAFTYAWTFGNGQTSTSANPTTTYTSAGDYTARLAVTDARGASSTATVAITVRAGTPPVATITSPAAGAVLLSGQTVTLAGTGTDPDPGQTASLTYTWDVTLLHEAHQHPGAFTATGRTAAYTVPFHGDAGETYRLLIRFTATDATGLATTAERTVPIGESGGETDVTDAGTAIALITAPTGGGSHSLNTIHDGVTPSPRTGPTLDALATLQYDTFTGDASRQTDWVGYTFAEPRSLSRLRFHEGLQFDDGGWFETLTAQVRVNGTWRAAAGLVTQPAYRGADGQHFDAYDLSFTPVVADGVRIVGRPGGASRFISVSELRVFSSAGTALGPLPAPWTNADIGPVYGAGSAGFAGGAFTVRGGGDVWGDLDHFHYVWQPFTGDGTFTARIVGLAGANPWAKAGLMIRASGAGNAPHAMLVATPGNGVHLQYRTSVGGSTEWQPGPAQTIPTWMRVQRTGSVVTASVSADGQAWSRVGAATVPLGQTALVGMMSTSTDYAGRNDLATATFTDVTLVPAGTTTTPPGAPADVTAGGTPVASVTEPQGGGSRSLGVLRDGVAPAATTVFPADLSVQYDTYVPNSTRAQDFFGYTFPEARTMSGLRFTEGAHFDDGGWFETLAVQVHIGGAWVAAQGLAVSPTYGAVNDGRHFDTYTLSFSPVAADGVRITGRPGGSAHFVSVSELRVLGTAVAGTVALPEGWASGPVGVPAVPGTTAYADGRFTLRGNGDVWGDADRFEFAYQALDGDGSIVARLVSVAGQNPWAKAGVMIRAAVGTSAPHAFLIGTPGRGVHFQYRTTAGAETGWQAGSDARRAPVWMRLQRSGNVFTAQESADGVTWATVGQTTIAMPARTLVGLVSSATDYTGRGDLATAVFSDVAVGGRFSGRPAEAAAVQAAPEFAVESVFPNPTRGATTVRLGIAERGTYRVEILDMLGRRVFEATLQEDAPVVRTVPTDLSSQPAGVYALRVFAEGGRSVMTRLTVIR